MTAQISNTLEMITYFQQLAEHDKASLARQLHDELGGLLISAVMDLSILDPRLKVLDEDGRTRVLRVRHSLRTAIDLTRHLTEQLHPTLLDNVGLFAALRWQLKNACAKSNVNCIDTLPEAEPYLATGVSIVLFRIAQEALVISVERSAVTSIDLKAHIEGNVLVLRFSGDGDALSDDPLAIGNVTLASIQHRTRSLGGDAHLTAPPRGGIRLVIRAPVISDARTGNGADCGL
jgi:two-component system sensor histidine kinase UhpB